MDLNQNLIEKCKNLNLKDEKDEIMFTEETGLTHECGVFGCIATGDWPSQIDVAQVICLGLVALQHRYVEIRKDDCCCTFFIINNCDRKPSEVKKVLVS